MSTENNGEHRNEPPPYPPATYGPPGMPPVVMAKSPGLALVASFFIPGLGSLIIGRVGIGILIIAANLVSWALTFLVVGFFLIPIVWIWGMVDAYHGAKAWNTRHGIVS